MPSPPPAPPLETLSGLIERVTFFNEENGFAILRVQVRGHHDLVTVVGALPAVSAGEWLHAEGRWVVDRDYGRQFRAELLRSSPPTTLEGIEKYLGGGMVKGIGPACARKLVGRFGQHIFDIIENVSARLEEVDGIGPKRRRKIKQAWAEQRVVRDIMVFLHSHGLSTRRAVRLYKTYGDSAIETVRANPYRLARDIFGIGFKTADQLARRLGIAHESLERACAGLRQVLLEATGDGHCALPVEALKKQAGELLQVGAEVVDRAFEKTLVQSEVAVESIEGVPLVFLPHLHRAEKGIAARLHALAGQPPQYPPMDVEKALAWVQRRPGQALAASQQEALRQALASRVLVITGGPGVGKTTLVNALLRVLRAKGVTCLLCAPTGRAARRLAETTGWEAQTIHRLLEVQSSGEGFVRREDRPLDCDLLVVDECSMVDVPLMHHLLRALPGGASLLLVGDADQLPSVGPGNLLRDLIESGRVPVVRLTEVFRQAAHSRIITTAHRVNRGALPEPALEGAESDFYFVRRQEPESIAGTLLDMVKTRIPARFGFDPIRDIQVLCPMNRGSLGIHELNRILQGALNPSRAGEPAVDKFGCQFRVRDKVLQTRNNYTKEVFNGDIGQVVRIDPVDQELAVRFDAREVVYDFGELDEVLLAYAITIHKSQGSEFPAVVIPLATQQYLLLQRNLLYTGITRGRKLVVLIGQPTALAIAVRNNRTERRGSGLLARLRAPPG